MLGYSSLSHLRTCLQISPRTSPCLIAIRHASLTSAIGHGIRKSRMLESTRARNILNYDRRGRNRNDYEDSRPEPPSRHPYKRQRNKHSPRHIFSDETPERVKEYVMIPPSIPYTTPSSEFLYGANAVEAALRCTRRRLYKLYIYQAAGEELSPQKIALRKLALSKGVQVKMAFGGWDKLLDRATDGRPHNGCVLEASPLPLLPVKSFDSVPDSSVDHFRVELAPQSREEAAVNGTDNQIPILRSHLHKQNRYPVTLLLDGILDPGNLGAIIRSAYYLGIDAIVFAGRNSAPLSPVAIKSSAGAAENMALLDVGNEVEFIKQSKANGWRFYAADAPGPGSTYVGPPSTDGGNSNDSPLHQSPSVLMMGSEGTGLSNHIRNQADSIVSIPGARNPGIGAMSDPARIDSLNVSVAAALLMEKFLRVPVELSPVPLKQGERRGKRDMERKGNGNERGRRRYN